MADPRFFVNALRSGGPDPSGFKKVSIHGPNSALANKEMLDQARWMKGANLFTPDEIHAATGWWLDHPDGVPRFELSDKDTEYTASKYVADKTLDPMTKQAVNALRVMNPFGLGALAEEYDFDPDNWEAPPSAVLKNSPMLTGYPDLNEINLKYSDLGDPRVAGYSAGGEIGMNTKSPHLFPYGGNGKATLLHELNHEIERMEGMSGGATSSLENQLADEAMLDGLIRNVFRNDPNDPDFDFDSLPEAEKVEMRNRLKMFAQDPNYLSDLNERAMDNYLATAGEAQARLVERRMDMTQEEMDADPFYKHYSADTGVPLEDMVHRPFPQTPISRALLDKSI